MAGPLQANLMQVNVHRQFFMEIQQLYAYSTPEMLHAECRIRLLEYQDEITIEPCSKKMKSTEEAYEKLCNADCQSFQQKVDTESTSGDLARWCISDSQVEHEMQKEEKISTDVLTTLNEVFPEKNLVLGQPVDPRQNTNHPFVQGEDVKVEDKQGHVIADVDESNKNSSKLFSVNENESNEEFFTSKEFIGPIYRPSESNNRDKPQSCIESSERDENEVHENKTKRKAK
ncbi:uncharacterized protein ACNFOS_003189, partial [Eudromia elegans]